MYSTVNGSAHYIGVRITLSIYTTLIQINGAKHTKLLLKLKENPYITGKFKRVHLISFVLVVSFSRQCSHLCLPVQHLRKIMKI